MEKEDVSVDDALKAASELMSELNSIRFDWSEFDGRDLYDFAMPRLQKIYSALEALRTLLNTAYVELAQERERFQETCSRLESRIEELVTELVQEEKRSREALKQRDEWKRAYHEAEANKAEAIIRAEKAESALEAMNFSRDEQLKMRVAAEEERDALKPRVMELEVAVDALRKRLESLEQKGEASR